MHVLVVGAAGMVGRKLVEALVAKGEINGKPIESLTLVDIVEPRRRRVRRQGRDRRRRSFRRGVAAATDRKAAGPDLPPRGDRVRRSRGRFREGLPGQSRRHARAVRGDPAGRQQAPYRAEARLHLFDRRLRRTVAGGHRRHALPDAAHQLRHAEGDRRTAARRLFAARLSSTASASACRPL